MIIVNLTVGSRFPVDRKKIRQAVVTALAGHDIVDAQIDISIVGKRKIKELNEGLLKHDGITDVLSFPQHERHQLDDFPLPEGLPPHLGDIVVCYPVAVDTARRFGKRVDEQICFYVEHGLMHVLGYHHD